MGTLTTRINKGRFWSACVGILSVGFVSSLLIPSVFSSASASAESVGSSTLSVRVKDVIAIRILDDTGTSSISTLGINIAPTPNGSTVTKNAIVDVATSNETGYTLYMDSDYKEDGTSSSTTPETQSTYTTDLIHTDPTVTVTIPSSVPSSSSDTNFWNYTTSWNDTIGTGSNTTTLTGSTPATVIPTHGTPDTIRDDVTEPSDSSMTTIGINVNVDNDIPSGTYKNKLVFTAVANELPPALPDFWTIATMQEMTPEICSSVYTPNNTVSMTDEYIINKSRALAGDYTVESDGTSPLVPEVTLLDDRDADGTGAKKSYKVRKLADGNCWMVENLAYDLVGLYNNGKRGIGSRNDGSTFEMTDENLAAGVEGYYTDAASALDYVIGPSTKLLTNITRYSYLGDVTGQTEYYYNWNAATAGQGSQSDATDGVSIDGSICPAGWRLPTSYTDTTNQNISWSALTNAYLGITASTSTTTGYQTLDQYPISLYRAGYVSSGNQVSATYGIYWSSTVKYAGREYGLNYRASGVYPQGDGTTNTGSQLRCVANPPERTFWTIGTMQEMTPEICATVYTPTNTVSMTDENIITLERYRNGDYDAVTSDNSSPLVPERTLLDDRDADGTGTKKSYKVRKLADGNCWMVDNLAYDLLALYNNGKRGIGSRNDGTTFEMTDANLASSVGYYTTTANAYDYVINSNTKPLTNITRQSYLGNVTGQTEYYYNWTAATAGQGSQSDATDGVSIDGSICPAGWRLPTNYNDTTNQNISWSALTNAYLGITGNASTTTGYQTLDQYPVSLYRVGYVYSGNQDHAAYGIYWSSTANSASNGYRLSYYTSYVGPQYNANKNYGFQLRCVASR